MRRPPPKQSPNPWSRLRWPVIILAVVMTYGVIGYMNVANLSFEDSVYMTLMVLTTVGLKEVATFDSGAVWLTISLMLMGVTGALITISLVARAIAEGGFGEQARRRRMQRKVDSLRDHYVICAYGRVGRAVAREFEAEGIPFVTVDVKEDLEEQMVSDGVFYIIGDPSSEPVLKAAGIERAKGLVCSVDSDAINVYITLVARALNPDIFIVARSAEKVSADRLYRAGADRVVSPYVSSGRHMALHALRPRVVDFFEVAARGESAIRLEEIEVEEGSALIGQVLSEAAGDAIPLVLRRGDGRLIPHPDTSLALQADDLLVLLGDVSKLKEVEGSPG